MNSYLFRLLLIPNSGYHATFNVKLPIGKTHDHRSRHAGYHLSVSADGPMSAFGVSPQLGVARHNHADRGCATR